MHAAPEKFHCGTDYSYNVHVDTRAEYEIFVLCNLNSMCAM